MTNLAIKVGQFTLLILLSSSLAFALSLRDPRGEVLRYLQGQQDGVISVMQAYSPTHNTSHTNFCMILGLLRSNLRSKTLLHFYFDSGLMEVLMPNQVQEQYNKVATALGGTDIFEAVRKNTQETLEIEKKIDCRKTPNRAELRKLLLAHLKLTMDSQLTILADEEAHEAALTRVSESNVFTQEEMGLLESNEPIEITAGKK